MARPVRLALLPLHRRLHALQLLLRGVGQGGTGKRVQVTTVVLCEGRAPGEGQGPDWPQRRAAAPPPATPARPPAPPPACDPHRQQPGAFPSRTPRPPAELACFFFLLLTVPLWKAEYICSREGPSTPALPPSPPSSSLSAQGQRGAVAGNRWDGRGRGDAGIPGMAATQLPPRPPAKARARRSPPPFHPVPQPAQRRSSSATRGSQHRPRLKSAPPLSPPQRRPGPRTSAASPPTLPQASKPNACSQHSHRRPSQPQPHLGP